MSKLYCRTPRIDIPEAFEGWETNNVESSASLPISNPSSTRYPVHHPNDLTLVSENRSLDFYIGFQLDGVTSYKNLSNTLDMFHHGTIMLYTLQPQIMKMDLEVFVPYSGERIHIKVSKLSMTSTVIGWCTSFGSGIEFH